MVDTESSNSEPLPPNQPYDDDLRTLFLPGLEASAAQARQGRAKWITPARLGTVLVIVTALVLGWLCLLGPLAAPLENALERLANRESTLAPTAGFTPAAGITPLPSATLQPILSTPTSSPAPTRTPLPTGTSLPTETLAPANPPTTTSSPTPTSPVSGCVPSSQVTLADVGKTICVSGTVLRISAEPSAFYIFLEDPRDAFYFVSYDRVWEDLEEDTCVYATGEIRQLGNNPIMILSYKVPLEYCP